MRCPVYPVAVARAALRLLPKAPVNAYADLTGFRRPPARSARLGTTHCGSGPRWLVPGLDESSYITGQSHRV